MRRTPWLVLTLLAALALVLSACSEDDPADTADSDDDDMAEVDDDELPTVMFQELDADPAGLPALMMQEEGIDREHGFIAERMTVDPAGRAATFLLGESDIGVERDIVDLTIAQEEGHSAVVFFPTLGTMIGMVTAEDAPYDHPEDLIGQTVGHFGVDSGTTQTHAVMLQELYGIDVFSDYNLEEAGPGALPDLLLEDRVDAYINFEPNLIRGIIEKPGKYVFLPYEEWGQEFDWVPYLTYLAARTEWLDENPDLAIAVRNAWEEAAQAIVDTDYEVLREPAFEEFLALPSEEHLDQFIEYCHEIVPCTPTTWGEEDLEGIDEYLEIVAEHGTLIDSPPEEPVAVILEDYFADNE